MYNTLANIVHIIHILLCTPFFFTFFYKSGPWLIYNLLLIPLIILDWHDDNQCSITSLEYKLRNKYNYSSKLRIQSEFFRPFINKILFFFNIEIKKRNIAIKVLYFLFMITWLVSFIKFVKYHGIEIKLNINNINTIEEKIYLYLVYLFIMIYIIDLIYKP
jgi:hypothetical protein